MKQRLASALERAKAVWAGMAPVWRVATVGGTVVLIAAFVFVLARYGGGPAYEVLYSRLQPGDAAEVVAILREQGIPYQLSDDGREIRIPADQVPGVRLDMAGRGLPRSGVAGWELFDETKLGMTDFELHVQRQRALEGHITRAILNFEQVQDAWVSINLPQRRVFIDQQQEPSASVQLRLYPGRSLTTDNIQAIVNLLVYSVEGLHPDMVTVVDTAGNVLTDQLRMAQIGGAGADSIAKQLEIQQQVERSIERAIQSLLEPAYGRGAVIARVRAEMNFDLLREEIEEFSAPSGTRTGLPRSEQIITERYSGDLSGGIVGGVPGVDSNIPGYVGEAGGTPGEYQYTEEIINYEHNRSYTFREQAPGQIERLSVAVLIDGDLDPLTIQRITDQVAAVAGIRPGRDTISVDSMPFLSQPVMADVPAPLPPESSTMPWWVYTTIGALVAGLLMALLLRRRGAAQPRQSLDVQVDDDVLLDLGKPVMTLAERRRAQMRAELEAVATERPQEVARLLRSWLAEE